ncbi:MAG: glycosyltransferase family 2 protein [Limisphaerales bacterium]
MKFEILAFIVFLLAALPCGLFLRNLRIYRPIARRKYPASDFMSVLIPARNEEKNIGDTLREVLANHDCDFEVIVLDDRSSDLTGEIIRGFALTDPRVRLEMSPPLPSGWCGKQHACHILAKLARGSLLVFLDADVRLAPDALARMAGFMESQETALASGVPHQELVTFSEILLIPLIHFVLLGFLPMHLMRRSRLPSMSAGCGQLFIARRDAYEQCGGHAELRSSLHDGLMLPRVFRRVGFQTGLFDATDLATCRMYHANIETWRGLGKNATEGLAAPGTILPMTALLIFGQVMPFVLLGVMPALSLPAIVIAAGAAIASILPRLIAVRKFRQPLLGALLHPLGILCLLAIQWHALLSRQIGRPSMWKGRAYSFNDAGGAA